MVQYRGHRRAYLDFCRESEQRLIRCVVHRQQWLSSLPQFHAERQYPASGGGVSDEDAVGQSADKAVSSLGKGGGDALVLGFKGRHD